MNVELAEGQRTQAIASIERNVKEHMDERLGNIQAAALLNFIIEEIGPGLYNKAVAEVQERLQERVMELDIECHADEFRYWQEFERKR